MIVLQIALAGVLTVVAAVLLWQEVARAVQDKWDDDR